MRLFLLSSLLLFLQINLRAQNLQWVKTLSGTGTESPKKILFDQDNNIYVSGTFSGTTDMDPGPATFNLSANPSGQNDIFICKFDSACNLIWAKKVGGTQSDGITGLALDNSGNIIVGGYFQGGGDFDPGVPVFTLTGSGSTDIFILKLDNNGNFIWAKKVGGGLGDGLGGLDVDASGNIYATGVFLGTVDFDPGAGNDFHTSAGSQDSYVLKLDASGNFQWSYTLGSINGDSGFDLKITAAGNVLTTGVFRDTVDFDNGPNQEELVDSANSDCYLLQLSPSGNFMWVKTIVCPLGISPNNLVLDNVGNFYLSGSFYGMVDFDPSLSSYFLTASNIGWRDVMVVKYDMNANFIWASRMGGIDNDQALALAVDNNQNVYTTGTFNGTADFDPNPLTSFLLTTADSNEDLFICKLNANGTFGWAKKYGVPTYIETGSAIACNSNNEVLAGGNFRGTINFGFPANNVLTAGNYDCYLAKFGECSSGNSNQNVFSCGAYLLNGLSITQSGIYSFIELGSNGCDSLVTINLSVQQTLTGHDTVTACESFTWIDGTTYTASTNTSHFLPGGSSLGCDSLVYLNLTINQNANGIQSVTACETYTWANGITYTSSTTNPVRVVSGAATNGCDSIINLHLTINQNQTATQTFTACNQFTWIDGITYNADTSLAQFIVAGAAANGCDSVYTLNLNINTVDTTVTALGYYLFAPVSSNSYQWLDCNNGMLPIPGQTGGSLLVTNGGNFAVILSENGCIDTSACLFVLPVGLEQNSRKESIHFFPNPTNDLIFFSEPVIGSLEIFDVSGRKFMDLELLQNTNQIDIGQLKRGIYFMRIGRFENETINLKIIKN